MLELKNISFSYDGPPVLQNINFTVQRGENVSVLGESGCGKSTLLKVIYGLLQPQQGEIYWKGKKLLGPDFHLVPGEELMKYVAQDFGLMPFITVEENVGKSLSNMYPKEKQKRVMDLLDLVGLAEFAKKKPRFLSGGQQQRVALASALAKEPEIILLDEPFSNIDNFKKNALRRSLFSYFKEKSITCLVATHDNQDSLAYADSILVLKGGSQLAYSAPAQLYNNPDNYYTASLFGEVNVLPERLFNKNAAKNETVLVYPHQLKVSEGNGVNIKVLKCHFQGQNYLVEATSEVGRVFFQHSVKVEPGIKLKISPV